MAATGNEIVLLKQLKLYNDKIIRPALNNKLNIELADGRYAAANHTHAAATTSAAGFMSAADKAKLDGLPNSFTDPAVDIVRTTTHSTSYTKDTLEIVTDSTGKVTEMWFVTAN